MRNHQITKPGYLLNEQGALNEPGYATRPLIVYNRENIHASRIRIKEWDYLLVMNENIGFAFTISDLGYVHMLSASVLEFDKKRDTTQSNLSRPFSDWLLPVSSTEGKVSWRSNNIAVDYEIFNNRRRLQVYWKKFYKRSDLKADLWFEEVSPESMVIATPFKKANQFYFNRKINCLKTSGTLVFNYKIYTFSEDKDLGVLDWGRGVWPYNIHWYWGTGSGYVEGVPFGFNLGYGFGDTSAASENMLFYDGKAYKLDDVLLKFGKKKMDPWIITSSDGRFEGEFYPDLDRAADINLGIISSKQHQYFGKLNAKVKLDDDKVLSIKNFVCAFEDIHNRY
jgi:hypothetical protein